MELRQRNKIFFNDDNLAYFSDLFEPTYRKFRLIRNNGDRRKVRIHNLKMHRKYVKYLDILKAKNPSLHWLSTTKIRALEDRLKNVFKMYDNNYPPEIVNVWKSGKMPFVLLSKRREKIILDVKVCKLYKNQPDTDIQAKKLLDEGMVVRSEYLLEGNFEYYKDETITGVEFNDIPVITPEIKNTISCNLFYYYYAKHDPAEYDDGTADYDISYLKEIEQQVNGEEKITEIRIENESNKREMDIWRRCKVKVESYNHPAMWKNMKAPIVWEGTIIIRNANRSILNRRIKNKDEVIQILSQSIICEETQPRLTDRLELIIYTMENTTDPTLSSALSITKHIDLHGSRRYVVIARKGSGKTYKSMYLMPYFEVVDSDLYGIWLRKWLMKNGMYNNKPEELKEKLKMEDDTKINEDMMRFFDAGKAAGMELYEDSVSLFRDLADGLLRHRELIDGMLTKDIFENISQAYAHSLANMINRYFALPKIGIGQFIEVIAAIKDTTKPLLIFMHSTEESGFISTPDYTFSMPDVFDTEDIVLYRQRGLKRLAHENYGEALLYQTYLMQTSTIQPYIPFPVLLSWIERIGDVININLLNE